MAGKNTTKQYIENGYYHIYNRGVEKRDIFMDEQDYVVFLRYLKEYLLPSDHKDQIELQGINPRRHPINCNNLIVLYAYCLMPNHFHLFLKQITRDGLKTFTKALLTNYVMYFNKKYDRVGPLFQGIYKGVNITDEAYYLHISRYIHRNPKGLLTRDQPLHEYPYSSYRYYLNQNGPEWLNTQEISQLFKASSISNKSKAGLLSYQSFVEDDNEKDEDFEFSSLTLE